ncbi:MAG TPA: hypothetical protein VLI05_03375 [Candidatus Saccharimonadia bacterium]|nr:hypothetical protein [Candidatus Saccharimonadia bacterium]
MRYIHGWHNVMLGWPANDDGVPDAGCRAKDMIGVYVRSCFDVVAQDDGAVPAELLELSELARSAEAAVSAELARQSLPSAVEAPNDATCRLDEVTEANASQFKAAGFCWQMNVAAVISTAGSDQPALSSASRAKVTDLIRRHGSENVKLGVAFAWWGEFDPNQLQEGRVGVFVRTGTDDESKPNWSVM